MKLSVVIIAFNEADNIGACIDSVNEMADEIIVLDSFSTDETEIICRKRGVRFEQHAFDGHIQQKNRAKSLATNEWVFSLDADERPDRALVENILELKRQGAPAGIAGFRMNRINYYCGKPIRTCGWYPDSKLRLWKKDEGSWQGKNPHDRFELKEGLVERQLGGNILHDTYPTHADMVRQVERFASISAKELTGKPFLWLMAKWLFSPVFKFLKNYFFRLGFTDGKAGFLICLYQAREVFGKYYLAIALKSVR